MAAPTAKINLDPLTCLLSKYFITAMELELRQFCGLLKAAVKPNPLRFSSLGVDGNSLGFDFQFCFVFVCFETVLLCISGLSEILQHQPPTYWDWGYRYGPARSTPAEFLMVQVRGRELFVFFYEFQGDAEATGMGLYSERLCSNQVQGTE